MLNAIISDVEKFAKPHKLELFSIEWEKWLKKDNDISLEPKKPIAANGSNNIKKLLKAANDFNKLADMNSAKHRIIQLINGHVGYIVGLIEKGQVDKAKEYLDVIRPQGWERNAERNIDKLYEQIVKELSEKLAPEDFQAIGL